MPRRMQPRALLAVLITVLASLAAVAPASAYFRNYTVVSNSTPMNSVTLKSGLVSVGGCPGPIFGGGASITPVLPNLGLHTAKQFGGYQFGGAETDGESPRWAVNGRGFCGENTATPPPAGGAGAYFKALQIVSRTSGFNSLPVKTAVARCPAGKTAITGGAELSDTTSDIALVSLGRTEGGRSWRVIAHEVDSTTARWSVEADATCANITTETATADYLNGYTSQVNPSTPSNSDSPKTITRTCPAGTPYVIGGGAGVLGNTPKVVITRSSPGAAGLSNTWTVVARETDPTAAAWALNASISCVAVNGGPPA